MNEQHEKVLKELTAIQEKNVQFVEQLVKSNLIIMGLVAEHFSKTCLPEGEIREEFEKNMLHTTNMFADALDKIKK